METHGLVDILIIVLAAKLGGELAERLRVPSVIGEIVAGLVVGPSLLGVVQPNELLSVLAEVGVILLLLGVGLEMDLDEMRSVGVSAMTVAIVGVVVPFASGYGVAIALGQPSRTALFIGAALTATSVGITARAFGDLRMLASKESRVVLGAAVADDILGLVILTVVVRIVEQGTFSLTGALRVLLTALVFLVGTTAVSLRLVPPLFRWIRRNAVRAGTLLIATLVLTLSFAELAIAAQLAPIIGAFVAGLALGTARESERVERDLAPLSHFFIPIFFAVVGVQIDVSALLKPSILGLAAALIAVAFIGKLAAGVVAGPGVDRLMIGIGMIPRGEVGLIFASIGLANGVLGKDLYGALLLVVLVTTVGTPGLIRLRRSTTTKRLRRSAGDAAPHGGWFGLVDGLITLHAPPPAERTLAVAFEAALLADTAAPSSGLIEWLTDEAASELQWNDEARSAFDALLRSGHRRAWRLLDATGLLDGALPDLADELTHRRRDASVLDPAHLLRWPTVDALTELEHGDDRAASAVYGLVTAAPTLRLAALAVDLAGEQDEIAITARDLGTDIGLGANEIAELVATASAAGLLRASASHLATVPAGPGPDLLAHLGSPERARRLYLIDLALGELSPVHREAFDQFAELLFDELSRWTDAADDPLTDLDQRRSEALALTDHQRIASRINKAPRTLIASLEPEQLVRDLHLLADGPPRPGVYRVGVESDGTGWRVSVAGGDQPGLLARIARALSTLELEVLRATVAGFSDRCVLDVFWVTGAQRPDPDAIAAEILNAFGTPLTPSRQQPLHATLDNDVSPWFTVCTITTADRPGLLADLTSTMCIDGVVIHGARLSVHDGTVVDRFDLSDRRGRKLNEATMQRIAERFGVTRTIAT
ncbi:MAG: cation:proton antiporter [Actinomycetes bacterium]